MSNLGQIPNLPHNTNKFYPPHINHNQSLLRTDLLASKLPAGQNHKRVIIIEAQAGQGKTTLTSQFIDVNKLFSIWYQVGPEDSDPVFLLSSLVFNLSCNIEGFNPVKLRNMLDSGSVGPLDLGRCLELLHKELMTTVKQDIYLVFDDLHLLADGSLTNSLFENLLDNSPPRVHFILLSRHPLAIKARVIRDGSQIAYLSTRDLALNHSEIEQLYSEVLKRQISPQDADSIQKLTNGWIMGILLASHPISGRPHFWLQKETGLPSPTHGGHMLDYFEDEIFAQIPTNLHTAFLELSFLQEIPVSLASSICGLEGLGQILTEMTKENYFVYRLDDHNQVFRLHHFFQEFLQSKARERLSSQRIAQVFDEEASYYLQLDMLENALICLSNGGNYERMAAVLKSQGMSLITKNRTFTILTLLQKLPDETINSHPWLILYAGLLRVDFTPQTTLPFFEKVVDIFARQGDETGELIALTQIIYYHFVISGRYRVGTSYLTRTRQLLEKNKDSLSVEIQIMAARNLASGYCFFTGDMETARIYASMATSLAVRHEIHNFIASSRFIQGYIELLSGNRARLLREAEACYTLFHDPLVGESNRLTMRILNLCALSMEGDHLNFKHQQELLQKGIDQTVVDQTIAAPYLYVWGSSSLISVGKTVEAQDLLEKGLGITKTADSPHMRSQLLQWQALALTLTGYQDQAYSILQESSELREEAGGAFHSALHYILAANTLTRLARYDEAETAITKGLALTQAMPSSYLAICARFTHAFLKLTSSGPDAALEDLEAGLSLMKVNGYSYFWGWEPNMMVQLLGLATSRDIEKSFCQALARQRLDCNLTDDGEPVPLLHFVLLDHFEIRRKNKVLLRAKDLTPFQRELLGLLITAKGQRIPQEKIQLELWPDSPPENARKSFDTLLARLRKIISPQLDTPIKDYLFLQKGILCLVNYQIDALLFLDLARKGLVHSKNGDWLQATSYFQLALNLYKGAMPEDTFRSEQIFSFNDTLAAVFTEMAQTWSTYLAGAGRLDEALALLETVLHLNYLEETLTAMLYRLHNQNGNHLRAKEILERYKKALLKADYSEAEASEFMEVITSPEQ